MADKHEFDRREAFDNWRENNDSPETLRAFSKCGYPPSRANQLYNNIFEYLENLVSYSKDSQDLYLFGVHERRGEELRGKINKNKNKMNRDLLCLYKNLHEFFSFPCPVELELLDLKKELQHLQPNLFKKRG